MAKTKRPRKQQVPKVCNALLSEKMKAVKDGKGTAKQAMKSYWACRREHAASKTPQG